MPDQCNDMIFGISRILKRVVTNGRISRLSVLGRYSGRECSGAQADLPPTSKMYRKGGAFVKWFIGYLVHRYVGRGRVEKRSDSRIADFHMPFELVRLSRAHASTAHDLPFVHPVEK